MNKLTKSERERGGFSMGLLSCGGKADVRGRHLNTTFKRISPFIPSRSLKRLSGLRLFFTPLFLIVGFVGFLIAYCGEDAFNRRVKHG